MKRRPFTIACIPAYNEERSIAKVLVEAKKYVDRIIVCDDGSSDLTAEIAESLGAVVVKHERNMGYGAALRTLFEKATELGANTVLTLDADGQHPPELIPRLLQPIIDGQSDIVVGSRFLEGVAEFPEYRSIGVRTITNLTDRVSGLRITDAQSGFRAYSGSALPLLSPAEQGMGASAEILLKGAECNLRVVEVPTTIKYRGLDTSTHNPVYHALDVISATVKYISMRHPLLFYGVPGAILAITGLLIGVWTTQLYISSGRLNTSLALISIGSMMIGLLLCFTAIILFTMMNVIRQQK